MPLLDNKVGHRGAVPMKDLVSEAVGMLLRPS